jgi:hypothetical protein
MEGESIVTVKLVRCREVKGRERKKERQGDKERERERSLSHSGKILANRCMFVSFHRLARTESPMKSHSM